MKHKYELTEETKRIAGTTVYRIKALRSFGDVKKGDLGGFVESKYNLSMDGDCWIYDHAVVKDHAIVRDDGVVSGYKIVLRRSIVSGHSTMRGDKENLKGELKIYTDKYNKMANDFNMLDRIDSKIYDLVDKKLLIKIALFGISQDAKIAVGTTICDYIYKIVSAAEIADAAEISAMTESKLKIES